ncbi:ABC transporter ATP-binding protein [Candidatus Poriferisocius sp.]|uniref:ABC transporter ATP-binding protein n=1 Tax=Candidatus Poriferisocius sp. TaxID=3101276 RepID=UPI003B020379
MSLIAAWGLTKRFGEFTAVDGIDFQVDRGEVFGFLGPNGAGKSSTMRMIGCVSDPTGGALRIMGMDPAREGTRIRARLGVVPQQDNLDEELSVAENLYVYGRYFDLPRSVLRPRISELLEFVQLDGRAGDHVEPLSGGMKRRLIIARALISEPEVLLLDEPTTGLDPQARHVVWERLWTLKRRGVTQVLTTHYMDEAEQLCDRLVVMDRGRIVAEGSPRRLIERYSTREVVELRTHDRLPALTEKLSSLGDPDGIGDNHEVGGQRLTEKLGSLGDPDGGDRGDCLYERIEELPDRVLLYTDHGDRVVAQLGEVKPESVLVRRSTLEDVFLHLTGRSLVD